MKTYADKLNRHYIIFLALIMALVLTFVDFSPTQAGDPDDVIGGMNPEKFECLETEEEDGTEKDPWEVVDLSEEFERIEKENPKSNDEFIAKLEDACDNLTREGIFRPLARTKIEGKVFEFHPSDPNNPAESEWFAVPSQSVPVIASGVDFEIFWVSEPDGSFYFYKTRFGEGPIILNLKLPDDAHPINPNILIESTGKDEVWTVFLGFYRGNVPPPQVDQLKTPNGNFLPFSNTKFEYIVGVDGKFMLPGVGGELPRQESTWVMALAAAMLAALPLAGLLKLRQNS